MILPIYWPKTGPQIPLSVLGLVSLVVSVIIESRSWIFLTLVLQAPSLLNSEICLHCESLILVLTSFQVPYPPPSSKYHRWKILISPLTSSLVPSLPLTWVIIVFLEDFHLIFSIIFLIWKCFRCLETCLMTKYHRLYQSAHSCKFYLCLIIISLDIYPRKLETWLCWRNYILAPTNSKVWCSLEYILN